MKAVEIGGFFTNRREKYVHLVLAGEYAGCVCGKPALTRIALGELDRLHWSQCCPTCLDGVPGFLDWWRREHARIPY